MAASLDIKTACSSATRWSRSVSRSRTSPRSLLETKLDVPSKSKLWDRLDLSREVSLAIPAWPEKQTDARRGKLYV